MSCVNCPAIKGTSLWRPSADLTHFASRKQLGAGIAANTPEIAPLAARSAAGEIE